MPAVSKAKPKGVFPGTTGDGSTPIDVAASTDNKYLYVLKSATGEIAAFAIDGNQSSAALQADWAAFKYSRNRRAVNCGSNIAVLRAILLALGRVATHIERNRRPAV
jgi:hypothetical protein